MAPRQEWSLCFIRTLGEFFRIAAFSSAERWCYAQLGGAEQELRVIRECGGAYDRGALQLRVGIRGQGRQFIRPNSALHCFFNAWGKENRAIKYRKQKYLYRPGWQQFEAAWEVNKAWRSTEGGDPVAEGATVDGAVFPTLWERGARPVCEFNYVRSEEIYRDTLGTRDYRQARRECVASETKLRSFLFNE